MSLADDLPVSPPVQPSLRPVWISLGIAVLFADVLLFLANDPWDWLAESSALLPDAWILLVYSVALIALGVPMVLGSRAIRAGRRSAWWPFLLAIVVFAGWGFLVLFMWTIHLTTVG